jgi:hypothetical protein
VLDLNTAPITQDDVAGQHRANARGLTRWR